MSYEEYRAARSVLVEEIDLLAGDLLRRTAVRDAQGSRLRKHGTTFRRSAAARQPEDNVKSRAFLSGV